jgi:TatD DNase family protein
LDIKQKGMNTPALSDYIDIHTHSSRDNCFYLRNIFAQDLATGLPDAIPCSIGLHPWHIQQVEVENCLLKVEEFASLSQVLALGESGLDRNIDIPFEIQEKVFMEHIRISEKISKPLVIHCVKAYSDLLQIRKSKGWKMNWMFHWFNENLAIANELLIMNCYLSFGRSLFHPNGRNAEVFRALPLDHIFLETDDAEVTIENVYTRAAELKAISVDNLKKIVNENFKNVFLNY